MVQNKLAQGASRQDAIAVVVATALVLPRLWPPTDLLNIVGWWQPYLQIPIMPGVAVVFVLTVWGVHWSFGNNGRES